MRCPFCGMVDTKVVDSRMTEGSQVRRRRYCLGCAKRFTTFELPELVMPQIIKRDGHRVDFDDKKLRQGIHKALEKRPVSLDDIDVMIDRVKLRLRGLGEREITSLVVGEAVMDELRELDAIAYIRFASVYREFKDLNQLRDEIERFKKN